MISQLLLATLLGAGASATQSDETTYAIRGARVHTLAGEPIEDGTVLLRQGRIVDVGQNLTIPEDASVIDASGLEVYPGLFDSVSQLGLTEIGSISATVDTQELGEYNPHLKAITAVHPASELIPVARANGITHAVAAPGGGGGFRGGGRFGIPGQASLFHLDGWTVEEMAIQTSVGMMVSWPSRRTRTFDRTTFQWRDRPFKEVQKEYQERVAELSEWIGSARHYAKATEAEADHVRQDDKLEALASVIRGEIPLIVRADDEKAIADVIAFAEEHQLRLILAGGAQAYKVKEVLAEKKIPVILGPSQALPREEDDPYDRPFTNAAELNAAGVTIAFATFGAANSRTLPYEVGHAVGFGLPQEEGVKAITINPAEILGLASEMGTIEEGKLANLIVTNGDPLEIRTEVKHLFVNGQPVSLDNRHLELYEKYRARPKPTK